ncbi:hypothetical protein [Chondromyces crocatus]|uniref:Uncharacterized protein n=1 Tax=Chondromyces crocatus TaxID=52 RepID=A0A0K1EME6_CHOCO|nr:hypothetical protein [Chondromyces crocatus]AKT41812.1 uncharacterized protein CMC5_060230 [Chondromyces crocatus]
MRVPPPRALRTACIAGALLFWPGCRPDPAEPPSPPPAPSVTPAPPSPATTAPASTPGSTAPLDRASSPPENAQHPATSDAKPSPFEVTLKAVVADQADGKAKALVVHVDPRFTVRLRVTQVEPATALLEPGLYDVALHSPSRTFGTSELPPGRRLRLRLTVHPPLTPDALPGYSGLRVE